jgi:hypothetical protein
MEAYTVVRGLSSMPFARKLMRWQASRVVQRFLGRMRDAARTYGVRAVAGFVTGRGLVATGSVPKGVRIGVYMGEVTDDRHIADARGVYLADFPYVPGQVGLVLDAAPRVGEEDVDVDWNVAIANHSCRRFNCAIMPVKVGWCTLLVLRTLRRVRAGEELLVDYDEGWSGSTQVAGSRPYWQVEALHGLAKDTRTSHALRCVCEAPAPCPMRRFRMVRAVT